MGNMRTFGRGLAWTVVGLLLGLLLGSLLADLVPPLGRGREFERMAIQIGIALASAVAGGVICGRAGSSPTDPTRPPDDGFSDHDN